MGISIDLKVYLVDLISIAMPHLQRFPGRQLQGTIDYSISSVSDNARSVRWDLTLVNTEAVTKSRHLQALPVPLNGVSLRHP
jgi:hypothetical protein